VKLEVCDVSKSFGNIKAVSNFTYSFTSGIYGLLGPNGAGKTTLMRILCQLVSQDAGKIVFNGKDVNSMKGEFQDEIGYLPQRVPFYIESTINEFLSYLATINRLDKKVAFKRIENILVDLDIYSRKDDKIKTLSGGMKQRVGIAQMLLTNPTMIVLDEPTVGLDPKERIRFKNLIHKLSRDRIVIISTHIVSDIEYIADKVIIMKNGEELVNGTVIDLKGLVVGKVWESLINDIEVDEYINQSNVISMNEESGRTKIRILSDICPKEGFISVEPKLEDVYMYYFKEAI
jgi:ABC-2 type transport system ATP-binding protein